MNSEKSARTGPDGFHRHTDFDFFVVVHEEAETAVKSEFKLTKAVTAALLAPDRGDKLPRRSEIWTRGAN